MHYYDEDKYAECPHCAAARKAEPVPVPEAVVEKKPEPVLAPKSGSFPEIKPEPVAEPKPASEPALDNQEPSDTSEPSSKPQPEPASAPAGMWRCSCGALNDSNFCYLCGSKRPVEMPAYEKPAEAVVENPAELVVANPTEPVVKNPTEPVVEYSTDPEEKSLTEAINEVSFTGSMGDAKQKAAGENDDEGVTQIIFDELADNLVLGWLVAVNTEIRGRVFTIAETKVTIGRSDLEHPTDIDLHGDRAVSRGAQAVLVYDPLNKKFFINSAGGKTSVYVNRQMVMVPVELSAGDIIMLGETELVFTPLCTEKFSW